MFAQASGIETPTRADLARIDRKRKKKGSNADWTHPHDPDARIAKMKETFGFRTYIGEPDRGPQSWTDQHAERDAVYANRRRIRGDRGRRLLRLRGELLERPNAHLDETGAMRRTHLRGHPNILKRLLVHVSGCNLGLLMRTMFGMGTPRGLQGRVAAAIAVALWSLVAAPSTSSAPQP